MLPITSARVNSILNTKLRNNSFIRELDYVKQSHLARALEFAKWSILVCAFITT
jgi:hypothetical protein